MEGEGDEGRFEMASNEDFATAAAADHDSDLHTPQSGLDSSAGGAGEASSSSSSSSSGGDKMPADVTEPIVSHPTVGGGGREEASAARKDAAGYEPAKLVPYFAGSVGIVIVCIFLAGWNSGDGRSKYNVDISGIVADKVQLPDGRYIAYMERGVSREVAKRNILVSHGFLSCRLAGIPGISDKLLEKYEVRLVAYDRPGIGQSDPHPKRNFNTSAQDMADIADALGMGENFWLLGYSGGGTYTWAALHYIPNRLAGVVMFAPLGNPYAKNMTKEETKIIWRKVGRGMRTNYRIARHFPSWLPFFFRRRLIGKPVKIMRSVKKSANPKDLALLEQDQFGQSWERSLRESLRSGDAKPHAEDYALFCSDWGFKLSDLGPKPAKKSLFSRMFFFLGGSNSEVFSGPIHIFHGTEDSLVPLAYSQYAKRMIPQLQLHILEGHGHFSWFCYCDSCHRELFKTLFGEVPGLDELDKAPEPEVEPTIPSEGAPHEEPDVPSPITTPEAATLEQVDVAHRVVTQMHDTIPSETDGDDGKTRNVVTRDDDEEELKNEEELKKEEEL